MKIQEEVRLEEKLGDRESGRMTLDENAHSFIISALIDQYRDPVGSIVREITSNAVDGITERNEKQSGVRDMDEDDDVKYFSTNNTVEVRIKPGSRMRGRSASFVVKDQGNGMSPYRIRKVYQAIGASTKRNANSEIGGFGLGAKCPFAYTSTYYVTSVFNGVKSTYMLDRGNGTLEVDRVYQAPCDELNGVEVEVPIDDSDLNKFATAIQNQLRFFKGLDITVPEAQQSLVEFPKVLYEDEYIALTANSSLPSQVLVGQVCYPLDFSLLGDADTLPVKSRSGFMLKVPVGSVNLPPSREALIYSKGTVAKILEVMNKAVDRMSGVEEKLDEDEKGKKESRDILTWAIDTMSGYKARKVDTTILNSAYDAVRMFMSTFRIDAKISYRYDDWIKGSELVLFLPYITVTRFSCFSNDRAIGGYCVTANPRTFTSAAFSRIGYSAVDEFQLLWYEGKWENKPTGALATGKILWLEENKTDTKTSLAHLWEDNTYPFFYTVHMPEYRKEIWERADVKMKEERFKALYNQVRAAIKECPQLQREYCDVDTSSILADAGMILDDKQRRKAQGKFFVKGSNMMYQLSYFVHSEVSWESLRKSDADLEDPSFYIYGTQEQQSLLRATKNLIREHHKKAKVHYERCQFRSGAPANRMEFWVVARTLLNDLSEIRRSAQHITQYLMETPYLTQFVTASVIQTRLKVLDFLENFRSFNEHISTTYQELKQYCDEIIGTSMASEFQKELFDFARTYNLYDQKKLDQLKYLEDYAEGLYLLRNMKELKDNLELTPSDKQSIIEYLHLKKKVFSPEMTIDI